MNDVNVEVNCHCHGIPHGHEALGSFSNDDGDGNENVKRVI